MKQSSNLKPIKWKSHVVAVAAHCSRHQAITKLKQTLGKARLKASLQSFGLGGHCGLQLGKKDW
jgi:hypothetical protein